MLKRRNVETTIFYSTNIIIRLLKWLGSFEPTQFDNHPKFSQDKNMDAAELKKLEDSFIKTKERMLTKECWPPGVKWKETIRQWIGAITIATRTIPGQLVYKHNKFVLIINFPIAITTTAEENFQIEITSPRALIEVSLLGRKIFSGVPIRQFVEYRKRMKLEEVPVNLHGDIVFEFVKALGGYLNGYRYGWYRNIDSDEEVKYSNLLCVEKQHLFPGPFEYLSLARSEQKEGKELAADNCNDDWVYCKLSRVIVSGNLFFDGYCRNTLVDELCKYQMDRFISYFFHWHNSKHLLKTARGFLANLLFSQLGENCKVQFYRLPKCTTPMNTSGKTLKDKLNFTINPPSDRETTVAAADQIILSCSGTWSKTIKEEVILAAVGNLTVEDVDWILHAFVEIYSTGQDLKKLLSELSSSCKFPTADDHFASFDPQFLRGVLAETDVSRKLMAYDRNILLLRESAIKSARPVPMAVVDLMESYFSPLL